MHHPGTLYLVGTPIGNLEDITLRALRILRDVGVIAAEDTRVAKALLRRHDIHTPLLSYHEYSNAAKRTVILDRLRKGEDVAVVTDAGMPGISDPGGELAREAWEAGIPVTVIPGPTAESTALAISGIPAQAYHFLSFLPAKSSARREKLAQVKELPGALLFYEAPHRLVESLLDMEEVLGDRRAVCARELTKMFEEVVRGRLSEVLAHFQEQAPRGEMTIVVEGATGRAEKGDITAGIAEARALIEAGMRPSRAVAHVAKWRKLPRRELYHHIIEEHDTGDG